MRFAILAALALAAAPAASPAGAAESPFAKACAADYARFCAGPSVTGIGAAACLRQNYLSLSSKCRASLKAARPDAAAQRTASRGAAAAEG